MITHQSLDTFLRQFPDTWLDYPFGEHVAVYKYGNKRKGEGKMFALIEESKRPVRVSLKCDPQLARNLRENYESVQPGNHLNKTHWNTVICSGQLSDDEVFDLARHSYLLVSEHESTR